MTRARPDRGALGIRPPLLRLQLLGGFRAVRDSGPPLAERWTRPSAQALVKMLAVAPDHQLHREEAMAACWPEADPESGIRSLRVALHAARRALEPELAARAPSAYLTTDGAMLRLEPDTVWIDTDHAERLARAALQTGSTADLAEALDAFTGELLPEDRYAVWASACRDRLVVLVERLRLALADALLGDVLPDEAAAVARDVLADNPTDERAHQLLMRAYLEQGLRRQAIRQYHACRDVLDSELGIRPGPDTERLHALVLESPGGGSVRASEDDLVPPPALRQPPASPLRGRDEAVTAMLDVAAPRVRLVGGEAGLGKTRLVTEAARLRAGAGTAVLWGAGHDAEGHTPYGAFVEALDGWLADRPSVERARIGGEYPELAAVLPTLGYAGADAARSPEDERQRLFRAAAGFLADLSNAVPVHVVLDDMHGADLGSFQLLSHLARRAAAGDHPAWTFAVAYRDDELAESDPRRMVLESLLRDGLAGRVAIGRLSRQDCEALAADVRALPTDGVPDEVWELSLGNPLFATELARRSDEPDGDPHTPPGVRQLVSARLARLAPATRRIVEVAAVAGGDAALSEVLEVAAEGLHPALSVAEATAAADDAVSGTVLAERDVVIDGRPVAGLVFDHPLVRMTCYEQISVARKRLLHAAYADAVLRRRPDAVDTLAAHLARADDPRATAYLRQAAERAAALCANDAADHYYSELTDRLDTAAVEAAWARIDHSDVLQRMGRYEEAARVLREAAEDLRRRGDEDGVVLATARLADVLIRSGVVDDAATVLAADQPTDATSALAATVHHLSGALLCLVVGRYAQGVEAARLARAHAERVAGPKRRGLVARALQYQAASLALDGRFGEAGPVANEALPHAEAFGDPLVLASVLSVQREQSRRSGRLREALETGHRALELAEHSGDPVGVAFEQANLAELHLLLDEAEAAETLARSAVDSSRSGPDLSTAYAQVALARVRMRTGSGDPGELLDAALEVASTRKDKQAEREARVAKAEWLVRASLPDEALAVLGDVPGLATGAIGAWAHLAAGRAEVAATTARAVIVDAQAVGECLTEVEARTAHAAALGALGLADQAADEFAAAYDLASRMPFPAGLRRIEQAWATGRLEPAPQANE
ncbi:ATP-binding protein [Monashia sp. NPDC004114]